MWLRTRSLETGLSRSAGRILDILWRVLMNFNFLSQSVLMCKKHTEIHFTFSFLQVKILTWKSSAWKVKIEKIKSFSPVAGSSGEIKSCSVQFERKWTQLWFVWPTAAEPRPLWTLFCSPVSVNHVTSSRVSNRKDAYLHPWDLCCGLFPLTEGNASVSNQLCYKLEP